LRKILAASVLGVGFGAELDTREELGQRQFGIPERDYCVKATILFLDEPLGGPAINGYYGLVLLDQQQSLERGQAEVSLALLSFIDAARAPGKHFYHHDRLVLIALLIGV